MNDSSDNDVRCVKTGNSSISCKVPNRSVKTPRSMLNSRNDKNCTTSAITNFAKDMLLKEFLRADKFNPLRVHHLVQPDKVLWYLSVLNTRIKVGSPTIFGLKDSQVELCQYKSHGYKTHIQVGINVKIPAVTATVGLQ